MVTRDRTFPSLEVAIFGAVLVTLTFVVFKLDFVNFLDLEPVKWTTCCF